MGKCRRYLLALLCVVGPAPLSAAPRLWHAPFGDASTTELPSVADRSRETRLRSALASQFFANRATPLLDRLTIGRATGSKAVRRRSSYEFDFAGGVVGIETSRLGTAPSDRLTTKGDTGTAWKSWSAGLRSGWALDTNDIVSVGIAGGTDHGPPRGLVVTYPHDTTSSTMVGLNWVHGDRWQMDLGWRQVGGSTHGVQDRMVQLSNGAPLHEAGVAMSVAFLPGGCADPRQTSIGFEARRASIAADDLTQINPDQRQVMQGALVVKTQF